jgi:hypothetical protein
MYMHGCVVLCACLVIYNPCDSVTGSRLHILFFTMLLLIAFHCCLYLFYLDERGGGIEPNIFAEHVVTEILNGKEEVTYESEHIVRFSDPSSLAKSFEQFNQKT